MTWILSLLSGALLGLSMPPHAAWGLEWVALVPLFIAVRRSGPLKAFGLGILTVLISSFFLIFPLRSSEEWGNAGGGLGLFALLIGWTCAFGAASRTASPLKWSLWMGAAGVLGEALAHAVFPIYLAMGQWQNVPIMSVASWTGIWGVSFLLYSFNAAIAYLLERSLGKGRFDAKSALSSVEFRFALIFVVLLGGLHAFGLWRMRQKIPGAPLRVAALQPGAEEMKPLLAQARASGAQVVVWPELSLSEPLERELPKYRMSGLYQVIGYSGAIPEVGLPENRAALVSPEGRLLGSYTKIHLFGSESDVHQQGKGVVVVNSRLGRSGLEICYDTMYTDVSRELAQRNAQILYVPNEDPTSSHRTLNALHAAVTVFRAAENGIPLVRSEWYGYSMIVDARGRIVRMAKQENPTVIVEDVILPKTSGTFYTRAGNYFPWVCLLVAVALIVLEVREDRKRRLFVPDDLGGDIVTDEGLEVLR